MIWGVILEMEWGEARREVERKSLKCHVAKTRF